MQTSIGGFQRYSIEHHFHGDAATTLTVHDVAGINLAYPQTQGAVCQLDAPLNCFAGKSGSCVDIKNFPMDNARPLERQCQGFAQSEANAGIAAPWHPVSAHILSNGSRKSLGSFIRTLTCFTEAVILGKSTRETRRVLDSEDSLQTCLDRAEQLAHTRVEAVPRPVVSSRSVFEKAGIRHNLIYIDRGAQGQSVPRFGQNHCRYNVGSCPADPSRVGIYFRSLHQDALGLIPERQCENQIKTDLSQCGLNRPQRYVLTIGGVSKWLEVDRSASVR